MKQTLLSILFLMAIVVNANAQNVNIPDANFKAYLVGNTNINTNGDSEIQTSEASAFTGEINCHGLSITDLTGIEAFTSLTELLCFNNSISSLDVSQNTALTRLECQGNSITSLDVSQNTNLTHLNCHLNSISSLDVTQNTALTFLHCLLNSISSLDVSQNTALTNLSCSNNSISSLDVSQNTALTNLECQGNSISSIDVSQNTALYYLHCYNNSLTSLNLANGNNMNMHSLFFNATNNPNLTCIQVDDVAWSTSNWTSIDSASSFSLSCPPLVSTSKLAKNRTKIYPNPVQDQLFFELENEAITAITILDFYGKVVQSIANPTAQSINVSNLPQGIYVLSISTKNGMSTNRFIKQ